MVPIVILGTPGLVTGGRRREEEEWLQVDLVPTLALLTGVPVPGVTISTITFSSTIMPSAAGLS